MLLLSGTRRADSDPVPHLTVAPRDPSPICFGRIREDAPLPAKLLPLRSPLSHFLYPHFCVCSLPCSPRKLVAIAHHLLRVPMRVFLSGQGVTGQDSQPILGPTVKSPTLVKKCKQTMRGPGCLLLLEPIQQQQGWILYECSFPSCWQQGEQ